MICIFFRLDCRDKCHKHCYHYYNLCLFNNAVQRISNYEGRTESHEQLFFACELGIAYEGECGGRWNQLLCYP